MTGARDGEQDPQATDDKLRLLPWTTPQGRLCYLSTDNPHGLLSQVADDMEAAQEQQAAEVLAEAQGVLDNPAAGALALRLALQRATAALGHLLLIARSRGERLAQAHDRWAGDANHGG